MLHWMAHSQSTNLLQQNNEGGERDLAAWCRRQKLNSETSSLQFASMNASKWNVVFCCGD